MTGAERKRIWREQNPERRREAERVRAQARRNGYWPFERKPGVLTVITKCDSWESNLRYEMSERRVRGRRASSMDRRLTGRSWDQQPENRARRNELARASEARRKAYIEEVYS
jgi:hypothetical protein